MGRSFGFESFRIWFAHRHGARGARRASLLESARRFWFAFLFALTSR
jgi:hypothetical protein